MKKLILGAAGMLLSTSAMAQSLPTSNFNLASVKKSDNLINASVRLTQSSERENNENERYRVPPSEAPEQHTMSDILSSQNRMSGNGTPSRGGNKVKAGFMFVADGEGATADIAVAGKPLSRRLEGLNR